MRPRSSPDGDASGGSRIPGPTDPHRNATRPRTADWWRLGGTLTLMTTTEETAPTLAVKHNVRFRRPLDPAIKAQFEIDGVDVAEKLTGIQIVADYAGVHVALEVHPRHVGDVEFESLATVIVNTEVNDPGPAAAKFLAAMDPETLEKAAMSRLDLENKPHGGTAAMLRQLIEWAEGKS